MNLGKQNAIVNLKTTPFILLIKNHTGPLHSQSILSPGSGGLLHGATQPWGSSFLD